MLKWMGRYLDCAQIHFGWCKWSFLEALLTIVAHVLNGYDRTENLKKANWYGYNIIHLIYQLALTEVIEVDENKVRDGICSTCQEFRVWHLLCNRLCRRVRKGTNVIQGGSNMTGTNTACLHTNQSRSYLNHLVVSVSNDRPW